MGLTPLANLDAATGDSSTHDSVGGKSLNKRKLAIPMIALIGVGGAVLVYIVFKMRSGTAQQATASPGIADPAASANQSASDIYGYLGGIQSLVGNLGQQMNTNFAALTNQPPATVAPTPVSPVGGGDVGNVTMYHDQYHRTWVDSLGDLMHMWYTPPSAGSAGGWGTEQLATGLVPNSPIDVNIYHDQFHIISEQKTGGFLHDWYTPPSSGSAGGWGNEILGTAIPSTSVTNPIASTSPGVTHPIASSPLLSSSGPTAFA